MKWCILVPSLSVAAGKFNYRLESQLGIRESVSRRGECYWQLFAVGLREAADVKNINKEQSQAYTGFEHSGTPGHLFLDTWAWLVWNHFNGSHA